MEGVRPGPGAHLGSGPGEMLELVRREGPLTRSEIQARTGLSRMTVGQRLAPLLEDGLVRAAGNRGSTGGRRPESLEFNPERGVVLVAALETTRTRTALTDLAGRILVDEPLAVNVEQGPPATLDAIVVSAGRLLASGRHRPLWGVGVALPGPVDPATARPSEPPIMPGWDAYPVAEHLEEALGAPVEVENDANAMALGEHAAHHPRCRSLVLVKVSTGIGAGLVLDGRVYRGVDGGAGDIGHVRLTGHDDAVCRCGARGCLAAVASGRAVAQALAALGVEASAGHHVRDLLAGGHAQAAALVREAGRRIGEVAATVVSLVNPGVLLLGGDLASAPLLTGVRETLYERTLPRATRHLHVDLARLGGDATVTGMTRTVVDAVCAPAVVSTRLGT